MSLRNPSCGCINGPKGVITQTLSIMHAGEQEHPPHTNIEVDISAEVME